MTKRKWSCYDCGSTIKGHHTPKCAMARPKDERDLEAYGETQWWVMSKNLPQLVAGLKQE